MSVWPSGENAWKLYAAEIAERFPLIGTDWEAHTDALDAGLYALQNRRQGSTPARAAVHIYADSSEPFLSEPPLSPEEEEAAAAQTYTGTLF